MLELFVRNSFSGGWPGNRNHPCRGNRTVVSRPRKNPVVLGSRPKRLDLKSVNSPWQVGGANRSARLELMRCALACLADVSRKIFQTTAAYLRLIFASEPMHADDDRFHCFAGESRAPGEIGVFLRSSCATRVDVISDIVFLKDERYSVTTDENVDGSWSREGIKLVIKEGIKLNRVECVLRTECHRRDRYILNSCDLLDHWSRSCWTDIISEMLQSITNGGF